MGRKRVEVGKRERGWEVDKREGGVKRGGQMEKWGRERGGGDWGRE